MRDQTIIGGFDLRDRAIQQHHDTLEAQGRQLVALTTAMNRFMGLSFRERFCWLCLGSKWLERRWMNEILLKRAAADAARMDAADRRGDSFL